MTIDDRILRKWTRKLAGSMEPDEHLVTFDTGRERGVLQRRVDIVVSTHATYIKGRFGTVVRVPHDDVVRIDGAGATRVILTTRLAQSLGQPGWLIQTNHPSQNVPDHIHEQWLTRQGRQDELAAWRNSRTEDGEGENQ